MISPLRDTALVLVVVLVAIACSSCGQDPEKLAKEQAAARQQAEKDFKDSVEAMIKKYGAERVDLNMDFTFQFEDALANKSGRPIVCEGDLKDIRTEDGSLTVVLEDDFLGDVNFRLRCTRDQATRLASSGTWKQVAFVAKIETVKCADRIAAERYDDSLETYLDVDKIIVARGELIDFVVLNQ